MIKRLFILMVVLAASFAVFNFSYLQKQIEFRIHPPLANNLAGNPAVSEPELQPNMLIIESLGIQAPIIYPAEENEQSFQEGLRRGVVHYPRTAAIGQSGNAYIFGHSSDFLWARGNYKTVFAVLPQIKIGEKIIATDDTGKKFLYKVVKTAVISPREVKYLEQGDKTKKILTLQTSYPVGTALKRFLVIAELE